MGTAATTARGQITSNGITPTNYNFDKARNPHLWGTLITRGRLRQKNGDSQLLSANKNPDVPCEMSLRRCDVTVLRLTRDGRCHAQPAVTVHMFIAQIIGEIVDGECASPLTWASLGYESIVPIPGLVPMLSPPMLYEA